MPGGKDERADAAAPDVVMTQSGALSPEEAAVRAAAGTLAPLASDAAMLDAARAEAAEERLGALGQLQAGVEGAAAGITFGASRLLDAGDPLAAAAQLERREVFGKTAIGGEVGGALLVALASGGQSLPGTLARLTPRGALEALALRAVASAPTLGSRVARGAAVGALEGGLDVAGNYLARVALDEDVEFSGAELGRSVLLGALVGAPAGGLGAAISPGALAPQARRVLSDEHVAELRRVLGDVAPDAGRRSKDAARKIWKSTDAADLDEVASSAMVARSRASYHHLQERVGDAARRVARDEVDEALSSPVLRSALDADEHAALGARLRSLALERDEAVTAASRWARAHATALGSPKNAKELASALRRVPRELELEAGPVLARFDQAEVALDAELAKLRAARAVVDDVPDAAAAASSPSVVARVRELVSRVRGNPLVAAGTDAAEKVATAAEVAQSVGLKVPSLSSLVGRDNVLGQAVSLLLQVRAGARVLDKASGKLGLAASPLTSAARVVNAGRARISGALGGAVAAATRRARPAVAPVLTSAAVKAVAAIDGGALREQVARDVIDLPSDVAAATVAQVERVASYLDRTRPRNPNGGTPWDRSWTPGPVAEAEYARRALAALDPDAALASIFARPGASLEVEALRECHPDVFARARRELVRVAADDELRRSVPPALRQSLGAAFGVPLEINQLPGYGTIRPELPAPAPAPAFGRPSATSTSAVVQAEQIDGPGSRRRRS